MTRRLTLLAVVTSVLVGTALPAVAVPPETSSFEFVDEFTDEEACDFPVDVRFVGGGTERLFFDKDGNLKKVIVNLSDNGTATNPANGKTVKGHDAWTIIVEFENGEPVTDTTVGLVFHFNAPGHGIVLIDAGRVVFDLQTSEVVVVNGPHQALEGDFAALCAALS